MLKVLDAKPLLTVTKLEALVVGSCSLLLAWAIWHNLGLYHQAISDAVTKERLKFIRVELDNFRAQTGQLPQNLPIFPDVAATLSGVQRISQTLPESLVYQAVGTDYYLGIPLQIESDPNIAVSQNKCRAADLPDNIFVVCDPQLK